MPHSFLHIYFVRSLQIHKYQIFYGPLIRQHYVGSVHSNIRVKTYVNATDKANHFSRSFLICFYKNKDVTNILTLGIESTPSILPNQMHKDSIQYISYYSTSYSIRQLDLTIFFLDFLKKWHYKISPVLTKIFQASLIQGTLPSILKIAKEVSIYKKCNIRSEQLQAYVPEMQLFVVKYLKIKYIQAYQINCDWTTYGNLSVPTNLFICYK